MNPYANLAWHETPPGRWIAAYGDDSHEPGENFYTIKAAPGGGSALHHYRYVNRRGTPEPQPALLGVYDQDGDAKQAALDHVRNQPYPWQPVFRETHPDRFETRPLDDFDGALYRVRRLDGTVSWEAFREENGTGYPMTRLRADGSTVAAGSGGPPTFPTREAAMAACHAHFERLFTPTGATAELRRLARKARSSALARRQLATAQDAEAARLDALATPIADGEG